MIKKPLCHQAYQRCSQAKLSNMQDISVLKYCFHEKLILITELLKKNGSDNNLEHIWNSRRMQTPKSTHALIAQYWPIPPEGVWHHRDTIEDMGYL